MATGLVIDVWLQVAEIQSPMETYIDAEIGPAYYPNRQFARFNEGFFIGGTNEWGYLGEGRPRRNGTGEFRVLLVGDSFVLCHTVFDPHHFGHAPQRRLNEELDVPVVVLNFARADFDLWNMHRYYRDFVCQWDHDLALLFVREEDMIPRSKFSGDLYPVTVLANGELQSDYSFRETSLYRQSRLVAPVLSRSAISRLAFNTYKAANRGHLVEPMLDKLYPVLVRRSDSGSAPAHRPDPVLPEVSRRILADLAADERVVLVLGEELSASVRASVDSLDLATCELQPTFARLQAGGIEPTYWPVSRQSGHWNHATHAAVGHDLADSLASQHLLAPFRREHSRRR